MRENIWYSLETEGDHFNWNSLQSLSLFLNILSSNLFQRHEESHTRHNIYSCQFCKKNFSLRTSRLSHQKRCHPEQLKQLRETRKLLKYTAWKTMAWGYFYSIHIWVYLFINFGKTTFANWSCSSTLTVISKNTCFL